MNLRNAIVALLFAVPALIALPRSSHNPIVFVGALIWCLWFEYWYHRALQHRPGTIFQQKRSEEHTSELQSRLHLVCRLLLEKKKKLNSHIDPRYRRLRAKTARRRRVLLPNSPGFPGLATAADRPAAAPHPTSPSHLVV